ncbi:DNA cytosine methyltransferase [Paenibacillus sp. FSL L8-0696]|uniref:DNA cytosine methyltransferase n=1 Tax=Paenibacillus sp. FSL L8-0696 TaxID=2954524 RepID=UPI003119987C
MREIIVDNFAGGGGASTGIELATGHSVDIAINHDPAAIAMHRVNHPETVHYCESVWDVDPREVTNGRNVALGWFSPDCKHFTKARPSEKPKDKNIRGLAWVKVRWGATVKPRVMFLENVEEFKTWGPLDDQGKPLSKKIGNTFNSFVNALRNIGYEVEWKELRACDYGAPTTRKRMFMISRCDGRPIVWPKPTHGDPSSLAVQAGKLKPWRTAAEIIDWSIPCPSIFTRKKALVDKTLKRIAKGLFKFIIDNPNPFIVPDGACAEGLKDRGEMVASFLTSYYGDTTGRDIRGLSLNDPLHTITAGGNRFGLVTSHLVKFRGNEFGIPTTQPIPTITAQGTHLGEVRALLIKYYGAGIGQSLNEPIHTIPTKDRFGLVLIKGSPYQIVDIGFRMLQPHELFLGQGFPKRYIIDVDADGKDYPKTAQVARCGNSVPPQFAEALVRANLPELCTGSGNLLTLEKYSEAVGQLELSM